VLFGSGVVAFSWRMDPPIRSSSIREMDSRILVLTVCIFVVFQARAVALAALTPLEKQTGSSVLRLDAVKDMGIVRRTAYR
jgi:hypothetical protein